MVYKSATRSVQEQMSIAGTPSPSGSWETRRLASALKGHRGYTGLKTSAGPPVRWPQRTPTRGRPSDLSSCANRAAPTRVLAGDAEPPPPLPPRPSVKAPELDFCFPSASPQAHSAAASASAPRRPSLRGPRTPRPDAALADRRRPRAAGPGRGNTRGPGGGTRAGLGADRGRGLRRAPEVAAQGHLASVQKVGLNY